MDGRFLKAFSLLPRQRTVCGRPTLPLCLRHRLALTAMGSPFVDGGSAPTPMDVIAFASVVSSTDPAKMMPDEPSDLDVVWAKMMVDDPEVFVEQVQEVFECIKDQSHWPIFWKKDKAASKGVPWVLSVICNLVKNGVDIESAWTMPEAQAVWMSSAFAIAGGSDIDIVSEEDMAMMEFAKRLDEEAALKEAANV